jgi:hypothetical protein
VIPSFDDNLRRRRAMMGRENNNDQGHLFYEFRLDEAVPDDHLVRKIDGVLDCPR